MIIYDVVQGTDEWKQLRAGKFTASRIADLIAKTKSGPAASRKNYVAELVCERLTGEPTDHFVSREMQWGTEHEPEARALYELEHDTSVEQVGFAIHDELPNAGASPDGLIGKDGAVEIKCPNTATHIETLQTRKVASRYYAQIQFVLDCTGRQWCDYISYDPRLKLPELQICVIRVTQDERFIERVRDEVRKADREVEELTAELLAMTEKREPVTADAIF